MKWIKYIFIFILIIVGIYTIFAIIYARNIKKFIKSNTGIVVSECEKILEEDSHGGMGDGETIIEYDCSKVDVVLNKEKLKELPLSDNLNLIMYGGEKDGQKYDGYNFAGINGIPKIEDGYYYFLDDYGKHYKDIDDYTSDVKLFYRYSYNFTLIMFDNSTKHLYYYELDT